MGNVWSVRASAEESSSGDGWTELSSNGNGAGAAGRTQSPNCQGNSIGDCDYATLGQAFPHGTGLVITNPENGRSGTFYLTDVGNGSGFGPAIGLTPAVQDALGLSGGEYVVHISLADGGDLSVVSGFGQLISGSGGTSGGATGVPVLDSGNAVHDLDPSYDIKDVADECAIHGSRAYHHADYINVFVGSTRWIDETGPA